MPKAPRLPKPASRDEWLSIPEAARRFGVHLNTVRNRLDADAFPHARQEPNGKWLIPLRDLKAARLEPRRAATRARVQELEREVETLMVRLRTAEALAEERLARIEDLRRALNVKAATRK